MDVRVTGRLVIGGPTAQRKFIELADLFSMQVRMIFVNGGGYVLDLELLVDLTDVDANSASFVSLGLRVRRVLLPHPCHARGVAELPSCCTMSSVPPDMRLRAVRV